MHARPMHVCLHVFSSDDLLRHQMPIIVRPCHLDSPLSITHSEAIVVSFRDSTAMMMLQCTFCLSSYKSLLRHDLFIAMLIAHAC